jgi:uncharacterized iron-regulated protein
MILWLETPGFDRHEEGMKYLTVFIAFMAGQALAQDLPKADVYFLGEVHDNPAHHQAQAELVAQIQPKAVVWEMLTQEQAAQVAPLPQDVLEAKLGWAESGWPDFAMYYPIFAASTQAAHYGGAVPREVARNMKGKTAAEVFGNGAKEFGLTVDLPDEQLATRKQMQFDAHCQAMPMEMTGFLVDFQRLRDASLAREALVALADSKGGPVVVITGNGHARKDWGAPAALRAAVPNITVFSLGQGETGRSEPEGGFDRITYAPPAEREDPCAAFH